jgi:hypothetical protein
MSMNSDPGLPTHVQRYLHERKIKPEDLPANVLETLSGLSLGEVALLQVIGSELRRVDLDTEIVAAIH